MKLGIFRERLCLIKTVYITKPIAFLTFSKPWLSSLLKLPNYWKISVPFLSQAKAYLKLVYQGGFSFKDVQYNCNKNQKL